MAREPVYVAFETEHDRRFGRGLKRLDDAERSLGVTYSERLQEPSRFVEVSSLDHGLGAVVVRAFEASYDVLVVSELSSLGSDEGTARQLCHILGDLGMCLYDAETGMWGSRDLRLV